MRTQRGRRLAGRYLLEERLAGGGMAEVWRGRDEVLGRGVAVKILNENLAADQGFFERFRLEAVAAARLSHPAVVRVFDTGVDDGTCFIVMELYEGETLAELLAGRGPLPPEEAAAVARGILEGLAHAHERGIVHRDVKPGNILVHQGQVKVADFGIAKAAFGGDLTTTGELLGTAKYLSPEQVEGGEVDARADLYAVGVVLYELLTGRVPFEAETALAEAAMRLTVDPTRPGAFRAGIPRELEELVMRGLSRRPEERFQDAEEMRAALERWAMAAAYAEPPPPVPVEAPDSPASFFRSWMLVPIAIVLIAVAAVVVGLLVGRLELGGPLGVRPAESPDPGREASPLEIAATASFDPPDEGGDGDEHGADAPLAIDGDPSSVWQTEGYNTPDLGGLKDGVGLVLDLGEPAEISTVAFTTPNPGWTFELWSSDDGSSFGPPLSAEGGETSFESSPETTVDLESTRTRYLMIWITELAQAADGKYRALVAEVEVSGV